MQIFKDGPIPKFQPIPIPILGKIPITDTDTDTSRKITKFGKKIANDALSLQNSLDYSWVIFSLIICS